MLPSQTRSAVREIGRRVLRVPPGPRRYLRRGYSVDRFLTELTDADVHYAVLRWFETLPAVEPGEDIDLLVADGDLARVEALLTPYRPFPETQKVDLYTESAPNFDVFVPVGDLFARQAELQVHARHNGDQHRQRQPRFKQRECNQRGNHGNQLRNDGGNSVKHPGKKLRKL